jgi:hypothetical protein
MLEERGKMTSDTGVQRKLILAEYFALCGTRKRLLPARAEAAPV